MCLKLLKQVFVFFQLVRVIVPLFEISSNYPTVQCSLHLHLSTGKGKTTLCLEVFHEKWCSLSISHFRRISQRITRILKARAWARILHFSSECDHWYTAAAAEMQWMILALTSCSRVHKADKSLSESHQAHCVTVTHEVSVLFVRLLTTDGENELPCDYVC